MVLADKLVKWINFNNIESNKRADHWTDASAINHLLLWTHVKKSGKIDYISYFNHV
jgi:hypothetical protein